MHALPTRGVPSEQVDKLDSIAQDLPLELRDLLAGVSRCLREGGDLVAFDAKATLTPNQAAERLGMSRSHLYKLMDRGELMFDRVGRDRRIRMDDLVHFEAERQRSRRQLAERFARQRQTDEAVVDEIADLL